MTYIKGVTTLKFDEARCTACGMCLEVCPHAVFAKNGGRVFVQEADACMECGACQRNCPAGAVTVHAGVGCAAAVIGTLIGRSDAPCCGPADCGSQSGGPCC